MFDWLQADGIMNTPPLALYIRSQTDDEPQDNDSVDCLLQGVSYDLDYIRAGCRYVRSPNAKRLGGLVKILATDRNGASFTAPGRPMSVLPAMWHLALGSSSVA